MTTKFDVSTLNWVKGEIDESLNQARMALENFVSSPDDQTQMGFCVMHLHQVRGTLQMVELYGAARVAEEMEQLAGAMHDGEVASVERGCEVLMRAVLQLPDYLEGLQAGQADNALVLLPLINEMRQARDQQPLPPSEFFQPDLDVVPPPLMQAGGPDARVLGQKARPYYQSALLHLLRGEEIAQGLKTLHALSEKLLAAVKTPLLRQWFWVFGGYIEALAEEGQLRTAAKSMLSKGDQIVKQLGDGGEAAVDVKQFTSLVSGMLFQVMQAKGGSARLGELKAAFGLESTPTEGDAQGESAAGGFNAELKKTLAADVLEELSAVQDSLDIFVRAEQRSAQDLAPMADTMARLASTLGMMGQLPLQQTLEQQIAVVRGMLSGENQPDDQILMGIATAVLAVESALRDWGTVRPLEQADDLAEQVDAADISPEAEAEHQRVIRLVMKEAKVNLMRVKGAVDAFVAAPGDASPLAPVSGLLHEAVGSLTLLSYKRVAQVLRACSFYIGDHLARGPELPSAEELDALADALTSVEYYLDAFVESRVHPTMVLEVAERAVAKLGYPVDALPSEEPVTPVVEAEAEPETVEELPSLVEEIQAEVPPADTESMPSFEAFVGEAPTALEDIVLSAPEAVPEPEAVPAAEAAPAPATPAAPSVPAPSVGLDEEIVEIFIEEATEEIGKINELLPRWQADQTDEEALRDLRRCFHTLKGSGRLVGAMAIGEFAWAYESMLNRVIDKRVQPDNAMFDLLGQGRDALPELVEQFRTGAPVTADVAWLEEAAKAMSEPGGLQALLQQAVAAPVAEEIPAPAETSAAMPEIAEVDPVLLDIYSTEAEGHLAGVEEFVTRCRSEHLCRVNESLTRALHTLHGSSRMAGIEPVANISGLLEKYAKALHTAQHSVEEEGLTALSACVAYTRAIIGFLQGSGASIPAYQPLFEQAELLHHQAQALAEGLEAAPEADLARAAEPVEAAAPPSEEELPSLEEILSTIEVIEPEPPQPVEPLPTMEVEELAPEAPAGMELKELPPDTLAGMEVEELALEAPAGMELEELPPPETLAGMEVEELAPETPDGMEVEEFPPETLPGMEIEELPVEASAGMEVEEPPTAVPAESVVPPVAEARAPARAPQPAAAPDYDHDLVALFLEEGVEILDASEETLQNWRDHLDDRSLVEALQRQLHTLKGGARMAGVTAIGDLSHTLESIFEDIVEGRLERSKPMLDLLQLAHDRLVVMLDQVRHGDTPTSADDLIGRIDALVKGETPAVAGAPAVEAQVEAEIQAAGEYDAELMSIYLNQVEDIMEACEVQLRAWTIEPDKQPLVRELERQLHTLKGASRTVGIAAMGDLAHVLESMLTAVADGHVPISDRLFAVLQRAYDRLAGMFDQLRQGGDPEADPLLISEVEALVAECRIAEEGVLPEEAPPPPAETTAAEEESEAAKNERRRGQRIAQDLVRVRSDLLDNLVNFAGEVSIYRSRVEQQVGGFNYNLRDFDEILERLREQLRQFAIETEAQMQSRYEEVESTEYAEFDPLEFDRFTHMQQLSRSTMESLNDLEDIQQQMQQVTRETETLLLQQARVNTELQEGLMHTRMVPLVENAPRLRRIVRQTCAELGKEVELRFQGAEVEMDRHMVERMLAPIEHLLRNAIAHGIEMPQRRAELGKSTTGRITIAQAREGSEVVIRVIDDGGGIDLERVRSKAIERGLMKADAGLSDKEVMHFILESGFSTAASLTQLAGRGVGMDVVNSEIKQLGGVLDIDTKPGEGTTFTMRLPLTLAVSRALLVQTGDDIFAVPMTSIQGIERIDRARSEQLLAAEHPTFTWLQREYELLPLSGILGVSSAAPVDETIKRPLLFARSGDHYVAWVADNLLGSREIVVKSLGAQLSALRGLSGATILGDGRVALILDLPLLARMGLAQRSTAAPEVVTEVSQPLVMVVDDSITVRKVTTRLLERNDYRAVTAKDGVDALAQLEEVIPDVMLLDIEMPRMDGYELATHIRNTERLKNIPIIMITSRSGEKHRQRALEIGVDFYMSKPYQENELLENIGKMVARGRKA